MIFVTVGTTGFSFDRLLEAIDNVLIKLNTNEKLIVQKGESLYRFKYPKTIEFKEIPFIDVVNNIRKSKIVITHGGPVTIFLALKLNNFKPLVVPRSKRFGEHINDHQIYFSKDLKSKNIIEMVLPEEDLIKKIERYLKKPSKNVKKRNMSASKLLIQNLNRYTQNLNE